MSLPAGRPRLPHLLTQAVGLPPRAVVLLLLTRGELTKLLERFVDLVVGLLLLLGLLLSALHGLVLIAQAILL